jgi:hypothetical protein
MRPNRTKNSSGPVWFWFFPVLGTGLQNSTLAHVQVPQAILKKLPDLRSVTSKWRWLVHAVFFSLVGYNLCLCPQDACHDRSDGVWFDIKSYWGLVIFENK